MFITLAVSQLASLYKPIAADSPMIFDTTDCHFKIVFEYLAELFSMLITLDDIIANQMILSDHWAAFKRVMNAAQLDPQKFNIDQGKLNLLRKLLTPTESRVLDGNLFRSVVNQTFDKATTNSVLGDEFGYCIREMMTEIEGQHSCPEAAL